MGGVMRSRGALIVAVMVIFGAAFVADYAGLVDRPERVEPSAAEGEGADAGGDGGVQLASDPALERQLKNGFIGGFVLLCLYVVMRQTGVFL